MLKQRIPETDEGIQDALTVEVFDQFARNMRDKGYHNIDGFLNAGIKGDGILEIGPGPGYVGLELLKALPDTQLTGCEISPEMRKLAQKNASAYGFADRVNYVQGNGMQMPFPDGMFDAVFSNGSLHEWEEPVQVFDEIHRVLRPGGAVCICDMRREYRSAVEMDGLRYHQTESNPAGFPLVAERVLHGGRNAGSAQPLGPCTMQPSAGISLVLRFRGRSLGSSGFAVFYAEQEVRHIHPAVVFDKLLADRHPVADRHVHRRNVGTADDGIELRKSKGFKGVAFAGFGGFDGIALMPEGRGLNRYPSSGTCSPSACCQVIPIWPIICPVSFRMTAHRPKPNA